MQNVLITGANGFIGKALCRKLQTDGAQVRGAVRSNKSSSLPEGIEPCEIADIDAQVDWTGILRGVDTIVHLAARVHVMHDAATDPLAEYLKVNVTGTEQLARAAVEARVKRFVFLSTVKVNGEENNTAYTEKDTPAPKDSYGISKLQAENCLKKVSASSDMEVVILRPPLVYGPGVKANFLQLLKIINRGLPLPLASIENRRSFIYLGNLVDAILTCVNHPQAARQTYFVSDDEDFSTPELIRKIAKSFNKSSRLFSFPGLLLFILGKLFGRGQAVDRILGFSRVDITKLSQELG